MATDLLALMDDAGVLSPSGDFLRSTVRISSIDDDLFLHSAYPIIKEDAVFFGPDTYRFARFIQQTLRTGQPVYAHAGRIAAAGLIAIMEVNGAGSEAIQAWVTEIDVLTGFRIIFEKQRILFAIGDAMRQRGVKPIGRLALMQLNRRQQRLIASYPPSN